MAHDRAMNGLNISPDRILGVACGLATMLAIAGCGGSDSPPTIDVIGKDFSYEGLPETIEAGTTLTLRNDSEVELHELVAVRLPDDEDRSVAELLQLPVEELGAAIGPASTVIIAPPSETGEVIVGSDVFDQPGRYAVFCAIPTEADPDEYLKAAATSDGPPDVAGGPPHFTAGMWAELAVTE